MIKEVQKSLTFSIIVAVLTGILGIVFIVFPDASLKVISNVIGAGLIIYGAFSLVNSFRVNYVMAASITTTAVLSLVSGFIIFLNNAILEIIIPFILGIGFIISGLNKLRLSIILSKEKEKYLVPFIISVLTMVCGILMIVKPIKSAAAFTIFIGILMIVYAVSSTVDTIYLKKKVNNIAEYFDRILK